jgi:hypothetical protein
MNPSMLSRRVRSFCAGAATILVALTGSTSAHALCSSPLVGRWSNLEPGKDPGVIDVSFISCGDTNTEPVTAFGIRPWIKQSGGQWFGRPRVKANFINSKGKRWLLGKVPTGGYVDEMFMRIENGNLRVFIRHKSLDSKPDASSWHTYRKT